MNDSHGKKELHEFFVDAKKYDSDHESLTGAQIKQIAGVTPTYQLFEEVEGDKPDEPISDSDLVHLGGEIKHFFAAPPATFGIQ